MTTKKRKPAKVERWWGVAYYVDSLDRYLDNEAHSSWTRADARRVAERRNAGFVCKRSWRVVRVPVEVQR